MARSSNVKVESERNPSRRDPESRSQPFVSVLLMAVFGVPLFSAVLRFLVFLDPDLLWLIAGLPVALFGIILPGIAIAIGYGVAKRKVPFVTWHVVATIEAFAWSTYVSVMVGWPATNVEWYRRLFAVVRPPMWWVVVYFIAAVFVALSWLLYRIDAFRSQAEKDGEDESGLAKLVRWPTGAKVRVDTIEADEFAITATIDHEGVPAKELQRVGEALSEHPKFVRGKAQVIPGERGGQSQLRLTHTSPDTVWRTWPGLSHPGQPYHAPIRTSYYSTGEQQWYSFVATPDGYRSPLAPDFRSPNGTFKGTQGATGSGKSGDAAIELADGVFSRSDVVGAYIDVAKLLQNATWCLEFCELAAASRAMSGEMFAGFRRIGEYRSRVLGQAGIRDFNHEAVLATGMPWIHIFADEFDIAKQGADLKWLATKGRSLGFRFSYTLPRATSDNLDTNVRGATGAFAQFGITQDYDKGFVLGEDTIEAGANPEQWGVSVPGAHYLDRAPGIPQRMWAIDCRTYRTRQDFGDLRAAVVAARSTFEPMHLTDGEIEAFGREQYAMMQPDRIRESHVGVDDDPDWSQTQQLPPAPESVAVHGNMSPADRQAMQLSAENGDRMFTDEDVEMDPETRAMLEDLPDGNEEMADIQREYGPIDPRQPIVPSAPDGIELKPTKPRLSGDETVAEFDAALIRMARRGMRDFTSADVREEMRCEFGSERMSERFTALTEDASLNPPGLRIERTGRGRFRLARLSE